VLKDEEMPHIGENRDSSDGGMVRNFGLIELKHARSKFPSYGSCKPTRRTIERNLGSEVGVCRFSDENICFSSFPC